MLKSPVQCLGRVGLVLNLSKTKLLTTQAQPPDQLLFDLDTCIDVIHGDATHKWLGCQLSMSGDQVADVEYHLQAASRAFWANQWVLCDRQMHAFVQQAHDGFDEFAAFVQQSDGVVHV